jgi:hypothetical protein
MRLRDATAQRKASSRVFLPFRPPRPAKGGSGDCCGALHRRSSQPELGSSRIPAKSSPRRACRGRTRSLTWGVEQAGLLGGSGPISTLPSPTTDAEQRRRSNSCHRCPSTMAGSSNTAYCRRQRKNLIHYLYRGADRPSPNHSGRRRRRRRGRRGPASQRPSGGTTARARGLGGSERGRRIAFRIMIVLPRLVHTDIQDTKLHRLT